MEGSLSANVGAGNKNLALAYHKRAKRAHAANDMDREIANLEQALTHYREAARIFRTVNHMDKATNAEHHLARVEEKLRQLRMAKVAETRG